MAQEDLSKIDAPQYAGGKKALTTTPIVGTPRREYAEMFVPGEEPLEDGELRVTVLGSGNPWVTRAQAASSILVEVGNPQRDLLILDLGSGSLANFASLNLPVNKLDKVFLTHLHADHMPDLITLFGSYRKCGRVGPVRVWGPSGSGPDYGTKQFVEHIVAACTWDTESSRGFHSEESMQMPVTEFDFSQTQVVYEENGVKITAFPVVHALAGAVGYRIDFAGLSFVFSGDTRPCWPLVEACDGGVDLLIHECFPPPELLAPVMGISVERASMILNLAHTTPATAGKVFKLVAPRLAGLSHTVVTPVIVSGVFQTLRKVYDGPVVQTQDLTTFNLTKEAVVVRQAQVNPQPQPIAGAPTLEPTLGERHPDPAYWAKVLIPVDDVLAP